MAKPSINTKMEQALTTREMRTMKIIGFVQLALVGVGAVTTAKWTKQKLAR
jgi:hypothetical protein